jgi:integrase
MYDDRNNYPFQTECTMLCQATGLRPETAKQIRRSMVKVSEGIIHLPKAILKGKKKDMEIIITQPVQVILDLVEEQRKKNAKYEFIPWLFPTTRVSSKKTGDNYYANSHHTRLSTLKGCWENVRRKLPDLVGSAKTFRKSFIRISKLELGTNAKVKVLSGHTQDSTIDTYYDKHDRAEAIESANKVSKVYSFIKKAK